MILLYAPTLWRAHDPPMTRWPRFRIWTALLCTVPLWLALMAVSMIMWMIAA